jgi:hypothetical protein
VAVQSEAGSDVANCSTRRARGRVASTLRRSSSAGKTHERDPHPCPHLLSGRREQACRLNRLATCAAFLLAPWSRLWDPVRDGARPGGRDRTVTRDFHAAGCSPVVEQNCRGWTRDSREIQLEDRTARSRMATSKLDSRNAVRPSAVPAPAMRLFDSRDTCHIGVRGVGSRLRVHNLTSAARQRQRLART